MATENESTLHKSGTKKSKKSSQGEKTSLYDVLPSLSIMDEQTGRRKSDEYLKLFQHLINQSNDAIFIIDPETGHLIDVNDKACTNLEYTYEDMLTMSVVDIQEAFPDNESWKEHAAKVSKDGSMVCEGVHKRKNRTKFPVEVSIKYVTHEKINYIIAFARDITERKKAEVALRESEKRFKTLTSLAPVGIYLTDFAGNCLFVNDAWSEMSGLSFDDSKGTGWINGVHPEDREKILSEWDKMICSGGTWGHEYRFRTPEGKITLVLGYAKKILNDAGEVSGYIGINLDITARKRAEERALRANQLASIGELAAGVAHEINNPINGIINYAQILENSNELFSKDRDIANRIIKEGNRIADIVSCLLLFARESREEKIPVNVDVLLAMALELVESQLQKEGIGLKLNIPQNMSIVSVQHQQIRQVFLNMISNARYALNRKYPGGDKNKVLEITCEEVMENDKSFIRIVFHDNGTGIPEAEVNKVMNPFFSTKPCGQGTGLGLSISSSIISEHGGELGISTEEGKYTEVVVTLPVSC